MNKVFDLLTLVVLGAMLADLVTHPRGTSGLVNGLTSIWNSSMQAVNPPSYQGA